MELDAFTVSPTAWVFAFVLGTLLGSFANVCIARIPRGMSIVHPPSHCFACGKPVAPWDNVPLLSYLILRGRCRSCRTRYSPRYLLVELGTGLVMLAVYLLATQVLAPWDTTPHRLARFAVYALFALVLIVISLIDLDHKKIPDVITYPGIPAFFLLGFALGDVGWLPRLIGVVVGYGVVRGVSDGYYYLTGREGLGYGDGKLLALVGALLGWKAVLIALFGGALLGSVIGVGALVIARRRAPASPDDPPLRHVELPFGPFLAAAALGFLFVQEKLIVGLVELWTP